MCENGNKNILAPIAWIMVALTAINVAFSYFIVDYKFKEQNIASYGSLENYEKALIVNKAQYDQAFKDTTKEDLEKKVNEAFAGGAWNEVAEEAPKEVENGKISKEDLVPNTPVYGKKEAKYSIYEFSDFDCPWCQRFHQTGLAKEAVDKNPDTLNHIVRNFPLDSIHPNARMKAELSLCVAELSGNDVYKSFVDGMFGDYYGVWKEPTLLLAESKWVDKTALETCLSSGKYSATVQKDFDLGTKMWVTWTPSIYVVNNETGEFQKLQTRSVEGIKELMK